ncbi:hypothetical protein PR001_g25612 [Phytophthora rubi]|uniref:TauD/TfdA-like domain-containing protein n=1 Tax=Phytophthora rubi TaxID=129364 RepID=A0A6A3I157_9STRA|nr:hypothetical protein PR001_g25612 [Phytophthora rubi]
MRETRQSTPRVSLPGVPVAAFRALLRYMYVGELGNALNQEVEHAQFEHPELTSVYPSTSYDPIPELPYADRALKADPTFKNLLQHAMVTHLAPPIGTELLGIQLHELSDAQRDELAMLVAERGVVFFCDQELDIDQQLQLRRYYGPLHVHQNLGHPKGYPKVLVVEKSVEGSERTLQWQVVDPDNVWQSDVSNEDQPPSYTSFKVLTNPPVGGDTLWASGYEAYERLTPLFKSFIEGLTAVHSSKGQAERYGGKAIMKDYGGVVAAEDKDDILFRVAPTHCQHGRLQAPSPAALLASGRASGGEGSSRTRRAS